MTENTKTRFHLRAAHRRVEIKGLNAIDKRFASAKALLAWRAELCEALGGTDQLSPQQLVLIDQVTRLKLYLDNTDSFLMSLPSLILKQKKKMVPLVRERLALAAELRATLQLIGLKKIPKLVSSIDPDRMAKILAVADEQREGNGDERPESI
jgi:hypothetical protein